MTEAERSVLAGRDQTERGYATCDNFCVWINMDSNNCGACGNVCPAATPNFSRSVQTVIHS